MSKRPGWWSCVVNQLLLLINLTSVLLNKNVSFVNVYQFFLSFVVWTWMWSLVFLIWIVWLLSLGHFIACYRYAVWFLLIAEGIYMYLVALIRFYVIWSLIVKSCLFCNTSIFPYFRCMSKMWSLISIKCTVLLISSLQSSLRVKIGIFIDYL